MFRFLSLTISSIALLFAAGMYAGAAFGAPPRAIDYRLAGTIMAPDARWDYLSVDNKARRLYVATEQGVAAVDLKNNRVTPVLVAGKRNHGVIPIAGTGTAVTASGAENALIWFDGRTGAIIDKFPTGEEPDAVVYEPLNGMVLTMNQRSNDATLIDLHTRSVVGTIPLGGTPEFAAADSTGLVYDNIEDKKKIAIIDVRARKIIGEIPLENCQRPTGLAYDAKTGLLLSACVNGVLDVMNAKSRSRVASLTIGNGADAVILDSDRRLAFVPCGGSGTLSVITLKNATTPKVVQTIKTKRGVRTGAVDPATGNLYLPSADFRSAANGHWPDVVPGTVNILVVTPSTP